MTTTYNSSLPPYCGLCGFNLWLSFSTEKPVCVNPNCPGKVATDKPKPVRKRKWNLRDSWKGNEMKTDRKICEAATPGPWELVAKNCQQFRCIVDTRNREKIPMCKNDEIFIAHFNPAKVAAMLDEIEELRKENESLESENESLAYENGHLESENEHLESENKYLEDRNNELENDLQLAFGEGE